MGKVVVTWMVTGISNVLGSSEATTDIHEQQPRRFRMRTCSKPLNVFPIGYTIGPHSGMATGENM
ncbi:Hypothetical predicted protein, partial [Olea europaea subsp. europaea]